MKIPRKCWPIGVAFVLCGAFAVTTALAAGPPGKGTSETGPPAAEAKALAALPGYMVVASNVHDRAYMSCVRTRVQGPGEKNLTSDFRAALGCR